MNSCATGVPGTKLEFAMRRKKMLDGNWVKSTQVLNPKILVIASEERRLETR